MVDSKRNKKDRGNIENTIEGKWLKQKIDFHLPGNFTDDSIILDIVHLCAKLKFTNFKKCINLWEI